MWPWIVLGFYAVSAAVMAVAFLVYLICVSRLPDVHRPAPKEQDLEILRDRAENAPAGHPGLLIDRPAFATFFCMVFPHRFGVELFRLIDHAIRQPY